MKTSIIAAAAVLSLSAITPVLAQASRTERVAPAYRTETSSPVVTGRSVSVGNASEADRRTFSGNVNTIGQHGFYGQ